MSGSFPKYCPAVKRCADAAAAAFFIVALSPVMLAVAVLVYLTSGSPVLFRQTRMGLKGRLWTMYKFRSMRALRDGGGKLLPDDARVTPFGRVIRRFKLDELPELANILAGDMSFVGPRPLLPEYADRYSAWENRRHEVRPGLTGWAQSNGNAKLDWKAKMAMDVWYVDHASFLLDALIILKTVGVVFAGERVNGKALGDAVEYARGAYRRR